MVRYFKIVGDGYIAAVGIGLDGEAIPKEEYDGIMEVIRNCPEPPKGYDYRLKENLTWEQHEAPAADGDDGEISDREALDIITGGTDG